CILNPEAATTADPKKQTVLFCTVDNVASNKNKF
ncbi:unnamed protein product, partial [Didymodactylos carnosus]